MVLIFAMAMGGNAGIYAMLPLFFVTERGMDLTFANTIIGLSQISGIVMVFVAGWISDKIGQKPAMAAALLSAAVFTVLLGVLKGPLLLVVLFVQPAVLSSFFPAAFGRPAMALHLNSLPAAYTPPGDPGKSLLDRSHVFYIMKLHNQPLHPSVRWFALPWDHPVRYVWQRSTFRP